MMSPNSVDSRSDMLELGKALSEFDCHSVTEQIKAKILWDNAVKHLAENLE